MEQINNNDVIKDQEFLNVHEILNHCTRVAQNSFGSNIKFIESFDPSLPYIYANKDLLIQIFLNLLKRLCLFVRDNFLESLRYLTSVKLASTTAAETTGPAKQPLPTSSTPAVIIFVFN